MFKPRHIFLLMMLSSMMIVTAANGQDSKKMKQYKQEAFAWIEENKDKLDAAAADIWSYEETALLEYKSAERLSGLMEDGGFNVERGVADMPTAFIATYGSGSPVIGILGEFDALPGLSQKAGKAVQDPLHPGEGGHGCGHNLLGVGQAGAALAMRHVMEKHGLKGTVKFFGCPAEETVVGKVYMAKDGLFNNLDVCLDYHPSSSNSVGLGTSNALNNFEVTFMGKTAHAAGDPWNGRSALDAVELMNIGVNFLREHVQPTVRIHYVIPEAGKAPNVVPDHTKVWYFVRGKDRNEVEEVYARVLDIAEGAAIMSGTDHEVFLTTGVYNKLPNRVVAEVIHKNLELAGPPEFTEEEQRLAREVQRNLDKDEDGLSTDIEELKEPQGYMGGGSTDVADVSWIVPTATLGTSCKPLNTPGHHWSVTTFSGWSAGFKGMRTASKTNAAAGIEFLMDDSLIGKAQEEFKEKTKDFTYKSAVPKGQKPRLPKRVK